MEELVQEVLHGRLLVHCTSLDLRHRVIDAIKPFVPAHTDWQYTSDYFSVKQYPYVARGAAVPIALNGSSYGYPVIEAADFLSRATEQEPLVTGLEALL